jgi:hypothetical protein
VLFRFVALGMLCELLHMNENSRFPSLMGLLAGFVLLGVAAPSPGAEVNVFLTNRIDRWVTNVILLTMPDNHYVQEYRTNWFEKILTNVVDHYATNVVRRTVTNEILVKAYATNAVNAYRTNLSRMTLTNWETVAVVKTNWVRQTVTNLVVLDAYTTNLVTAYRTNLTRLNLTNWETVLVMKTNWVTQMVTNTVGIDLPARQVADSTGSPTAATRSETIATVTEPATISALDLVLEATRTRRVDRTPGNEVLISVRTSVQNAPTLQIRQWRVEGENGSVLCFGQDPVFRRALPVGRYRIEVQVQPTGVGVTLVARGTLVVTVPGVSIEPRTIAQK